MEKPFDSHLPRMSKNQLLVLKYLLALGESPVTHAEIAKRTAIVEKQLGGVLSAMSRRVRNGLTLIVPSGRSTRGDLRWRLNSKAITVVLAQKQIRLLLASYER